MSDTSDVPEDEKQDEKVDDALRAISQKISSEEIPDLTSIPSEPEEPAPPSDDSDEEALDVEEEEEPVEEPSFEFTEVEEDIGDKLLSDMDERLKEITAEEEEEPVEEHPEGKLGKILALFKRGESVLDVERYNPDEHGPLTSFDGVEGWEEVERYWVYKPYAFVVILHNPEDNAYLYNVVEPELDRFEQTFLDEVKQRLRDILVLEEVDPKADKEQVLEDEVIQVIQDYAIEMNPILLEKILYYVKRDFVRFGQIDVLMRDSLIEDISCNGYEIPIYLFHKNYHNIPTNLIYEEQDLNSYIIRLAQRAGKHISVAEPLVDATLPDGSRIQMTLGKEVTTHGSTFTIRRFSDEPVTPIDLINWGTFSVEAIAYLWLCIENNKSLIFAGGTASGKTTSMNAVSLFIPYRAKIVTLEDTRELQLPHPNWIPGITRSSFSGDGKGEIDMYELLRAALRQRPEYLIVGEVRGKEALTLFQAMSTGHTTYSTMHADSIDNAIHRLENPPISVPRTMIQALNIMSIQAQTFTKGKRVRRNLRLVEIVDLDPNTRNLRTNDVFEWDSSTDTFHRVGESKALQDIMLQRGWNKMELRDELENRRKILEFMLEHDITDFKTISTIIHAYQETPEKVLTKLGIKE